MISNSTTSIFRRSGSLSARLSSGSNDVPTLSSLGGVVRTMGSNDGHQNSEWSGATQGFVHGGYYAGDGHYEHVDHQQDIRALGQENWTVRNAKPDHSVSQEIRTTPGHQHERGVLKNGSSAGQSGSSQEKTGPRSESLPNDEAKPNMERSPKEVAARENKVPEAKTETRIEVRTSS
jgi:hypothetical protein